MSIQDVTPDQLHEVADNVDVDEAPPTGVIEFVERSIFRSPDTGEAVEWDPLALAYGIRLGYAVAWDEIANDGD